MAEEKRKQEEKEKAQRIARQQQERKALVKMSHETQQPAATVEQRVVPAPLPKKISSEVSTWPSRIHIQEALPRQGPEGYKALVENKAQASPVLGKVYNCCPCLQEISVGLCKTVKTIHTRRLKPRFIQYNRRQVTSQCSHSLLQKQGGAITSVWSPS